MGYSHSSDHDHVHGHDDHHHHHEVTSLSSRFLWGIALNLAFVGVEFTYGKLSNSIALVADAGHNLQDVFSLVLSGVALWLAEKPASLSRTYGYKKGTVLSAFLGGLFLVLICGGMIWEAIGRFSQPETVDSSSMMIVAAIGVVINLGTAFLFFSSKDHELNSRSAYLHLLGDAGISCAVVLSGFLIMKTGFAWIDPVVSLLVAGVILVASWRLFRESFHQVTDGVPTGIHADEVVKGLESIENASSVHHVHIWSLSTREIALTAHIQVKSLAHSPQVLAAAQALLRDEFNITHATLQIEPLDPKVCESCG